MSSQQGVAMSRYQKVAYQAPPALTPRGLLLCLASGGSLLLSAHAAAAPISSAELLEKIAKQEAVIAEQQQQLQLQQQQLDALKQAVTALQQTPTATPPARRAPPAVAEPPATANAVRTDTNPEATATQQVGLERRPKPKEQPPKIAAVPQEGGVLLPAGQLVLEPTVEYSNSSALRVAVEGFTIIPALNIGSFEISDVDRDTITTALSARLGLGNRFELSGRVPYVYRSDTSSNRPIGTGSDASVLNDVSGDNIGDIEFTGSYQLNSGRNGWPFFIANARFKTRTGTDPFEVATNPNTGLQEELPTGSGFYAIQPSVTAIYPSDPVVLYGTLGYTYNVERDIGGEFGEIDPGDSVNTAFGMGFAVNEKVSFSLGFSHDVVFETEQNGQILPTSDILQVGQFSTGFAYKLNDRTNLNLSVATGLTEDAPDMRVTFRVPVRMQLF